MRQIIILRGEVSTGGVRITAAFWFPRSSGDPQWRPITSTSQVPDVTDDELAALQGGTVIEEIFTTEWIDQTQSVVQSTLTNAYSSRKQSFQAEQSLANNIAGMSWSQGGGWNAPAAPTANPDSPIGAPAYLTTDAGAAPTRRQQAAVAEGEAASLASIDRKLGELVELWREFVNS